MSAFDPYRNRYGYVTSVSRFELDCRHTQESETPVHVGDSVVCWTCNEVGTVTRVGLS